MDINNNVVESNVLRGWIARDNDLLLFYEKPIWDAKNKFWVGDIMFRLGNNMFPEIREYDSPTEVVIIIKQR